MMANTKKTAWTPSQMAAIELRGKNLLVSAAAGSGKTATLTERIIRSVTDPTSPKDISKMLVVTFTRAAASELRMKISKALAAAIAENPQIPALSEQLIKLGDAKICTIDSFYYDFLREHAHSIGLPSSFKIGDEAQLSLLAKDVMNDVITENYAECAEKMSPLAECFTSTRSMGNLPDIFLDIYSKISAYPEGIDFLRDSAEKLDSDASSDFLQTEAGKHVRREVKALMEHLLSMLEEADGKLSEDEELTEKYYPSFAYNREFCLSMQERIAEGGYEEIRTVFLEYSPIPLKRVSKATDFTHTLLDLNKKIEKKIRKISSKFFSLAPPELSNSMLQTADMIRTLYSLFRSFGEQYTREKLDRGVLSFDDIRRYVLNLLVTPDGEPTELAVATSKQFTDIYIDEYQDVDRVQDMIFSAISNGKNRFMVGDIKQSIYSFRGAEPSVFASLRASFPENSEENSSDNAKIFMSDNFRCDENVIRFTNLICSYLFGICRESIGYTEADDLRFSKALPSKDYISPKVNLVLIAPPDKSSYPNFDRSTKNMRSHEAKYIAREVKRLLSEERKADGTPLLPCDIAVIFRTKTMLPPLKRAFEEAGLEYTGGEDKKYFENPDVLLLLSLLNTVDNPSRDIHLAAVLRSPLFSFTLDELIRIRIYCDSSYSLYEALLLYTEREDDAISHKCEEFLCELRSLRNMVLTLPVDKLLQRIYASSRFSRAGLGDSENLTRLYEYARTFESGSFRGLYNFIEYINKLISQGTTLENHSEETGSQRVNFITAHHSKGLEFPVCFVCGTASPFNTDDTKASAVWDPSLGFALKLSDSTGFAKLNTPMREAIISKMRTSAAEEELRVLYVALTRARERLYVTGYTYLDEDEFIWHPFKPELYSFISSPSQLSWIIEAMSGKDTEDICKFSYVTANEHEELSDGQKSERTQDSIPENRALVHKLSRDFAYSYPCISLSKLPSKLSVSRLSPDILDENDTSLSLFDDPAPCEVPEILISDRATSATPAERGTATHQFLQFCDFKRGKEKGVADELERLIREEFLPSSARELVYLDELERFFESELFKKIIRAKRVIREQRFNILLPPSMFSQSTELKGSFEDELLAVQGVIDLVIIDEEGRLCLYDYKTDRLTPAELSSEELLSQKMRQRHSQQLSYYKLAVEELFDAPCETVEVYSTHAAKTVK